jgi:two-component system, cell cycle sensor histidine kinase and response regulator CckA
MPQPLRVLILEDRLTDARLVVNELRHAGYEPRWERVDTEQDFVACLDATFDSLDLILADYNLPQFDAPRALQRLQERGLNVPFIIVSGFIGEETAVAAMKDGAADFLLKDRLGRLGPAVTRALEQRQMRDTERKAELLLRERTQLILLTSEIGLALNRTGSLHNILQHCAESIVHNLDVAMARIWTLAEAENMLELQASAGQDARLDAPFGHVTVGEFTIGRVARDRMAHVTNDLANDPHFGGREWVEREGLVALAAHSLIVEDRLVGVLAIFSRHPLTQTVVDAVATAANQIAAGIERRRTESKLQFTQFTIDHIGIAVFWTDSQGRFFNVNEAACKMTGYSRAELLSLHVSDLDLSHTPQSWPRTWRELQQRQALAMESRLRRKNGTKIPISVVTNLLHEGGHECCCIFVQDIIDRKAAEVAQRQSELRFRAIFDQTFEFVGLLNADGTVLEVNQPALDFRGLTLAEVAGLPLWETRWLDLSDQTREQTRQVVLGAAAGNFVRQEMTVRDDLGNSRVFDFSVKPILNDGGRVELLIAEARDITDQKRLEEQFRQAQKMEAVGKLAGGVAHDFNNLLTIILGYSEILQESLPTDDPLLELVDQVHKAGQRAAGLTRQLLAFSRKQVLLPVVLDLNTLLADVEKMLRRLIGEDVDFAFRPAASLWRVRVDAGQMEQVLMNLVVNARDAMPEGGKLTIETSNVELDAAYVASHPEANPGEHVLIAVSDTGHGMDRATLAQIFEPFFSTKGEKGTGLGLATVYGIVKQSGGHISVQSEQDCGTTFTIYLPRDRDTSTIVRPNADSQGGLRGNETILLVEDEDAVRTLATSVLKHYGYKVLAACHGEEALRISDKYRDIIHLLATDVVMPNLGGRELTRRLCETRPQTKVLYLSGYMDDAIVRHGLQDSGHPFLQKPYSPATLAKKVREVLDR